MPMIDAIVQCPVFDSVRVRQVAGMFDLRVRAQCTERFRVELPAMDEDWRIGIIVGPSGSGKSTIARQAFGDHLHTAAHWPANAAVIDGFGNLSVQQITHALTAVGFSTPPAWIKPYAALSTGEKFRCDLARGLLWAGDEATERQSDEGEEYTSNERGGVF